MFVQLPITILLEGGKSPSKAYRGSTSNRKKTLGNPPTPWPDGCLRRLAFCLRQILCC